MKATVLLAHPYEKSFNHAIYLKVLEKFNFLGIEVFGHDLYKEEFNPVLTKEELGTDRSSDALVNLYAGELVKSDLLVFIHPNWWGQPPAVLKGYIDRVIRPPYCYDFPPGDTGGGVPEGRLKGKYCLVFNTSNTEASREENIFGDPLERIWKDCICGFCGITNYARRMFRIVSDSTPETRGQWLLECGGLVEASIGALVSG